MSAVKRKEKVVGKVADKARGVGKVRGVTPLIGKVHGDLMYDVVCILPNGVAILVGDTDSPLKEAEAKRDSYATASMLRADGIRYGIRPSA